MQSILQKKPDTLRINIGYARVSSKKQEDDLKRQIDLLEMFLAKQGKPFKIISDVGSGINYSKTWLKELIKLISLNQIDKIYVLYKDRLVRFGFELIEEFAKLHSTNIEIVNQTDDKTDEEELVEDILNIIHVFSCKLNDKKSHINKKVAERLLNENYPQKE
jgi:putative resolvase